MYHYLAANLTLRIFKIFHKNNITSCKHFSIKFCIIFCLSLGERIVSLKNVAQANDGRDALAKALYGRMFGWIVREVNKMFKQTGR